MSREKYTVEISLLNRMRDGDSNYWCSRMNAALTGYMIGNTLKSDRNRTKTTEYYYLWKYMPVVTTCYRLYDIALRYCSSEKC